MKPPIRIYEDTDGCVYMRWTSGIWKLGEITADLRLRAAEYCDIWWYDEWEPDEIGAVRHPNARGLTLIARFTPDSGLTVNLHSGKKTVIAGKAGRAFLAVNSSGTFVVDALMFEYIYADVAELVIRPFPDRSSWEDANIREEVAHPAAPKIADFLQRHGFEPFPGPMRGAMAETMIYLRRIEKSTEA